MRDDTTPTVMNPDDTLAAQLECFRQDPTGQDLFRELRRTLKKQERFSELAALNELRASVESTAVEQLRLWLDAANLFLQVQEHERAFSCFRRLLAKDPCHESAAGRFFEALLSEERFAEAADVVEAEVSTLELKIHDAPSALTRRLASRYRAVARLWQDNLGRLDKALQCWQRSFQLDASKTEALRKSREIYASLGDEEMVATLYQTELQLIGKAGDRRQRSEIEFALGRIKRKRADTEGAAQHLESAVQLNPESLDAKESLAEVLASLEGDERHKRAGQLFIDLGERRMRTEDPEGAIRFMRRALGVDPNSQQGTDKLETMLRTARRWPDLDRLYTHQLTLASNQEERGKLLERHAELLTKHHEDRKGLKSCLRELTSLHSPGSTYSNTLRDLYEQDQEGEELVTLLEADISSKSPDDPALVTLLLELATIYRQQLKDRDRAAEVLHRILAYDPLNSETLARYAEHFRERRDWRGLTDLDEYVVEKMRELNAPVSELVPRLEGIAELCESRLGDIDRAVATWRRVQELEGHNTKSSAALQRLMSRAKMWESLVGVLEQEAQQATTPEARAETLRRIAQVYRERKVNPRRTIALYEEVLTMFPEDEGALKALTELYDREGDDRGLVHSIRRRLDLESRRMNPGASEARPATIGRPSTGGNAWPVAKRVERLTALRRIAVMYEEQLANVEGVVYACSGILELLPGDREALERMERVLDKADDTERLEQTLEYHVACSTAPVERSKLLRRLAALAAQRSDDVSATERWEQVLGCTPNDTEALGELAQLYDRQNRHQDLAEVLDRALMNAELPTSGSPAAAEMSAKLKRLAHVLDAELEAPARAMRVWKRVLEISERDRDALNALCRLYDHSQEWRELAEVLSKQVPLYLEDDTEKAASFALRRAQLLEERLGSPELATQALEELISEVSPRQIEAHRRLRRLYETRGDFEAAVRVAEREIVLLTDDKAKINRGLEIGTLCRDRLSDSKRALQAYERVLQLEPTHQEALSAAADLYAKVGSWSKYISMLQKRIALLTSDIEKRALMLRIANVSAEELADHRAAFHWYTQAHELAPDSATLSELRRAAENYGLWRELANVYEGDREQLRQDEVITDPAAFVQLSRDIADIAERRLRDTERALNALYEALQQAPLDDALLSEAQRVAAACNTRSAWQRMLECFALPLQSATGEIRIQLFLRRAQLREEQLRDQAGALTDLLSAFSWAPQRDDIREALLSFGEKKNDWNQILSIETALVECAPSRAEKVRLLHRKANSYEEKAKDPVRAFRSYLSAFLVEPEFEDTLAHLWRLARDIGVYTGQQRTPQAEHPAAHIEELANSSQSNPAEQAVPPRREATQELNIGDLLGNDDTMLGRSVDPTRIEPLNYGLDTFDDASSSFEHTQEIDLNDLVDTGREATMEVRTEDLIEALGSKRSVAPPTPRPATAERSKGQGPPPPPTPRPTIQPLPNRPSRKAAGSKSSQAKGTAPLSRKAIPTAPIREYSSPWSELASVYCKLPASSDQGSLRWRYKAAEVWENGALEIGRAFDVLTTALLAAPTVPETRERLSQLAEKHNQWDRLAQLYDQTAEAASSAEEAANLLLQVATIRSRQNRPQETESLYRRVLGMRPSDALARASLEQLYRAQERWVDLAAQLEERTDPRLGSVAPISERPSLLRELAEIYSTQLTRPHDAIDTLERLLDIEPERAEVLGEIAVLYEGISRWSKVIHTLNRLCDLADGQQIACDALRKVARIYEKELELPDRAIVAYSSLLRDWPSDDQAFEALDRLYQQYARWSELDAMLHERSAVVQQPIERAELLRRQANIMLKWLDNPADAAAALRHARTLDPENKQLVDDLVVALVAAEREQEAAVVLEERIEDMRASAANGEIAALLIRLGILRGDKLNDPIGARSVLKEALERVPSHPTALATLARLTNANLDPRSRAEARMREAQAHEDSDSKIEALLDAGQNYRECGDFEGATLALEQVLDLRPFQADATWALSALVEQGGNVDEAIRLLSARLQAASLEPSERAEVLTQLAALSRQAGVESEAEDRLKEALEQIPGHLPAVFGLADLLTKARRWQDLEIILTQLLPLLEEHPPATHAEVLRRLALSFEGQAKEDQAYQTLIQADRLSRNNLLIKLALGENRYAAKRWREAALHLSALAQHKDALTHPSEVAAGLYHAALAEIRALRPDKAEALYEAALNFKNNFAPALQALAEIAMERDDIEHACSLMTKQAVATEDPASRLALFEHLGDMVLSRLQDGQRAKTCYEAALRAAEPLDRQHLSLMQKLLQCQESDEDYIGAGRTCELLASFSESPKLGCDKHVEAVGHFLRAEMHTEARAAADRAVQAAPHDLQACNLASKLAMLDYDFEATAAMLGRLLNNREAPESPSEATTVAALWYRLAAARAARGDSKGAEGCYEKAIDACTNSEGAMQARRALLELWIQDKDKEQLSLEYLRELAASSLDASDVAHYAKALSARDNKEGTRSLLELAVTLGHTLNEEQSAFLSTHSLRTMAEDEAYKGGISNDTRSQLLADGLNMPLAEICSTLWEHAALLWSDVDAAFLRAGVRDAKRVGATRKLRAAAVFTRVARALNAPATILYTSSFEGAPDVQVVCASPPIVVFGPRLLDDTVSDSELRFQLARAAELARPARIIISGQTREESQNLIDSLCRVFGNALESAELKEPQGLKDEDLRKTLPVRARAGLEMLLCDADKLDLSEYQQACQRAADRAGLLIGGDLSTALEQASAPADHLKRLPLAKAYLGARTKLGIT